MTWYIPVRPKSFMLAIVENILLCLHQTYLPDIIKVSIDKSFVCQLKGFIQSTMFLRSIFNLGLFLLLKGA